MSTQARINYSRGTREDNTELSQKELMINRYEELMEKYLDDPDMICQALTGEAHNSVATHNQFLLEISRLAESKHDAELGELIRKTLMGFIEADAERVTNEELS